MTGIVSFNSKLVRLEALLVKITENIYHLSFNSKLVRLEVNNAFSQDEDHESFNSKLVRLEEALREAGLDSSVFQFQTGSIRSVRSIRYIILSLLCFNSKLVRLEVSIVLDLSIEMAYVSIPNWFD